MSRIRPDDGRGGGRETESRIRTLSTRVHLGLRDTARLLRAVRVTWQRGGARELSERVRAKLARPAPAVPSAAVVHLEERLARSEFPRIALPEHPAPIASIVIPAHDHFAHTYLCLESIAAAGDATPFEVIVSDDASSDATASIESRVAGLRVVRSATNEGFVASANRGAAAARGELLVFLNNDTFVQPGWLDALVWTFATLPDVGAAGARLLFPDGTLQESGGILWRDASGWNFGRGDAPDRPACAYLRDTDYCSAACLAVPRALFRELGGFDAAYAPGYYEDVDLAFRVRAAGRRVVVQPASRVIHFEGVSAGTDVTRGMKRHQIVNRERFAARWRDALAAQPAPPPGSDPRRAPYRDRRAHVLVIDARLPDAGHDAGSLRLMRILEMLLDSGCAVTMVPEDRARPGPLAEALARRGVEVYTGPWLRSIPAHLREHGSLYDLVWISRKHLAEKYMHHVRRRCPDARVVFDTVDLHFVREARQLALEGKGSAARASALLREEIDLVRGCDTTLVVSEAERELLHTHAPEADVRVLSTIHDAQPSGAGFEARSGALFVGSFEHAPNVDAMRWYVDAIHPILRAARPDFVLRVIGTDAPAWLRDLREPGIAFVGPVADLAPHFAAVRLSIAPLRFGAGVKGKINTSQSYGVPVVATAVGVEGMQLVHGESVWVADSPDAFAAGIARVHEDEALWGRLAEGSRRNLAEHFSTARARSAIEALLAERGSPGRTPLRG
jgi:GT2 family glycosyltransferase